MVTVVDPLTLSSLLGLPHWAIRQIEASGGKVTAIAPDANIETAGSGVLPPDWQRLPNWHIECPASDLADALGITIQRVNQLAGMGIVVKTRHGFCDGTESFARYVAYQLEPKGRAGAKALVRGEEYWRAKARERNLRYGWTATEVDLMFSRIEAIRQGMLELQACLGTLVQAQSKVQLSGREWKAVKKANDAVSTCIRDLCNTFLNNDEQAKVYGEWLLNDADQAA